MPKTYNLSPKLKFKIHVNLNARDVEEKGSTSCIIAYVYFESINTICR